MSLQYQYRPVNPRLGTYYATFASAILGLVLVLAMLEQLGARRLWLSHIMILGPVVLYAGVAAATRTLDLHEFFSAGRRVPAVFGGLSLAATTIGGTGFFALTGCLYLIGFDALSLALGWAAGFALCAILFTPFLRKSGAYTLPSFFRQRFNSRIVGAVGALLLLPPVFLLLAAELRIGAFITSLFVSASFETAITAGAVLIAGIAILGGMRSVSWTQCGLYLVVITAFLIPLTVLSVQLTNLPLPQLTYGTIVADLTERETAIGAAQTLPRALDVALPGERPEPSMKQFLASFGAISAVDFLMLAFCFMAGTAALPTLLMRAGTAPSVFESRRAMGWGTLFLALFLISVPAYAAFAKLLNLQELATAGTSGLPDWIGGLRDAGLAALRDSNADGRLDAGEMFISRDGVTLALPIMAGYPFVVAVLVAAGGISATLAAGIAHALTAGAAIGEDLVRGLALPNATPGKRMIAARLGVVATVVLAAWLVAVRDFDILPLVAWAMSLSASTFLPALVLAIWWPRITRWGLVAAMVTGFVVASAYILLTKFGGFAGLFGVSNLVAAVYGVPAGFIAGIGVSYLLADPTPESLAMGDEIRDPSGETIQDRAVRLAAGAETGPAADE